MYIYIERYVAEEPEITQTDLCLYTHIHKIDGGRSVTPLQRGSPEPRCTAQRPHSPPPCPPHPPLTAAPRGRTGKMAAASPQAGRAAGRGRPPAAAGGHGGAPGAGTPGGRGGESGRGRGSGGQRLKGPRRRWSFSPRPGHGGRGGRGAAEECRGGCCGSTVSTRPPRQA